MGDKKMSNIPAPVGVVLLSAAWSASVLVVATGCQYLGNMHAYGEHTRAQVALAVGLCCVVATWVVAESIRIIGPSSFGAHSYVALSNTEPDPEVVGAATQPESNGEVELQAKSSSPDAEASGETNGDGKAAEVSSTGFQNKFALCVRSLSSAVNALRAGSEMAAILAFIYLCDRTNVFGKGKKVYDRAQFWGLWALICVVALVSVRKIESTKPLQRDQTDEWKGWMQLMFLMYHYFKESEVYNAIRVYIAAYVFMTGFGNFSLYLKGKSFTIRRTLQMLFRLNFLGCAICVALNNEYMLYYICAMHTLFTIFVIIPLYIKQDWNSSTKVLYAKIGLTALFTIFIYDGPNVVFTGLFGTLPVIRPLFAFHDPLHPEFTDEMHEWHFRSGLDRFIWIIGMVVAMNVPLLQKLIDWLQSKADVHRHAWTVGVLAVVMVPFAVWVYYVFLLDKFTYNHVHPYTSSVPIVAFLLVRNLLPSLRQRYLFVFAWIGRYTLETYILQFHVWMRTTGNNGSPKSLLVWVPDYYWVNFALVSVVYIFLSVRISNITITLRDALIPEQLNSIGIAWACVFGASALSWCASFWFK